MPNAHRTRLARALAAVAVSRVENLAQDSLAAGIWRRLAYGSPGQRGDYPL